MLISRNYEDALSIWHDVLSEPFSPIPIRALMSSDVLSLVFLLVLNVSLFDLTTKSNFLSKEYLHLDPIPTSILPHYTRIIYRASLQCPFLCNVANVVLTNQ